MADEPGGTVQYRILGPVDLVGGDRRLAIPGAIRRGLLGYLVINAGQTVTLVQIIEALWGRHTPNTATAQVHAAVSAIRRVLRTVGSDADLVTQSPGYRLAVEPARTDLGSFESLLSGARDSGNAGHPSERAEIIRRALLRWRGVALSDAAGEFVDSAQTRLDQLRLGALEDLNDLELALGRHRELIAGLRALVDEHPLRERPHAQLMTALYRCDRQAEALTSYRELRDLLARDHGIDPPPALAELYYRILNADPSLAAPAAAAVDATGTGAPDGMAGWPGPAQLPPDTADFTGREQPVRELRRLLTGGPADGGPADGGPASPRICVITGVAGVGKTATAVRVAYLVRSEFPDGQVFVDLRGASEQPMPAGEALAMLLRAVGVASHAIPPTEVERTALFRSRLAGRRVLIVLDNAGDAPQVKPLLPGSPTCAVLITSRQQIMTIPGSSWLCLKVFTETESAEFLGRLVAGAVGRPAPDPSATRAAIAETARMCGNLPLALRIVGARASGYPAESLHTIAERLADQQSRLNELELHDLSVRSSFELSYRLIGRQPGAAAAARAFRLISLLGGVDVTLDAAAQLLDQPLPTSQKALAVLAHAQLLRVERPGRYRMHDLLRLYASERAAMDEPADQRHAAIRRLLRRYLAVARRAGMLVEPADERHPPPAAPNGPPSLVSRADAFEWFDAERATILSALRYDAANNLDDDPLSAELVVALRWLFRSYGFDEQWEWALRLALRRARASGSEELLAVTASELGELHDKRGDRDGTLAHYQESLRAYRAAGDRIGEIQSLNNVGMAYHRKQSLGEAMDHYQRALAAARAEGSRRSEAYLLANIAAAHRDLGHHDDAIRHDTQALAICRSTGDRYAEIDISDDLAMSYRAAGRYEDAIASHRRAAQIAERIRDRPRQRTVLRELGETHLRAGEAVAAIDILEQVQIEAALAGDRYSEGLTLWQLGRAHAAIDAHEPARLCWRRALTLLEQLAVPEAAAVHALLAGSPVR